VAVISNPLNNTKSNSAFLGVVTGIAKLRIEQLFNGIGIIK